MSLWTWLSIFLTTNKSPFSGTSSYSLLEEGKVLLVGEKGEEDEGEEGEEDERDEGEDEE